MFVSITLAFGQLLQLPNTKFPFSQEDHSYTVMNDVTLNPLVCNCQMLHFIAGHLMVYLFMLDFMTVTAVSQWRGDPFLSEEASFEFSLSKQFCHICLRTRLGSLPQQSLRLGIVLQLVYLGGSPRKQEFSTGKGEMEKGEKTMQGLYRVAHRVSGCLSEFSTQGLTGRSICPSASHLFGYGCFWDEKVHRL